jgi:hypothetical protein
MKFFITIAIFIFLIGSTNAQEIEHALISASGTRYEGFIIEGTMEKGHGIFHVKTGDKKGNKYEGDFCGDKMKGNGILTTISGFLYIGEWENGDFQGKGTATFPSGYKHVGEFEDGIRQGIGTTTTSNGDTYTGEWKDDNFTGKGFFTEKDGNIESGIWQNGTLVENIPISKIREYLTSVDIEENIPQSTKSNENVLAIVFGIKDYKNISNVTFADRDARFIKKYFFKTLGVKESNIYYKTNDDVGKAEFDKVFFKGGWLDKRVREGKTEIYFYYAGHGAPDIKQNKAYLIPYDGDPNYASQTGYELGKLYSNLADLGAKSVTVFLDACFSGANRESEMLLADARPIFIEVEGPAAHGITVFSATSSKEISSAWPEKKHGLFSYFLMKGLQGEADLNKDNKLSIKELGDYIQQNVSERAGFLDREQTPQLITDDENRILINY